MKEIRFNGQKGITLKNWVIICAAIFGPDSMATTMLAARYQMIGHDESVPFGNIEFIRMMLDMHVLGLRMGKGSKSLEQVSDDLEHGSFDTPGYTD